MHAPSRTCTNADMAGSAAWPPASPSPPSLVPPHSPIKRSAADGSPSKTAHAARSSVSAGGAAAAAAFALLPAPASPPAHASPAAHASLSPPTTPAHKPPSGAAATAASSLAARCTRCASPRTYPSASIASAESYAAAGPGDGEALRSAGTSATCSSAVISRRAAGRSSPAGCCMTSPSTSPPGTGGARSAAPASAPPCSTSVSSCTPLARLAACACPRGSASSARACAPPSLWRSSANWDCSAGDKPYLRACPHACSRRMTGCTTRGRLETGCTQPRCVRGKMCIATVRKKQTSHSYSTIEAWCTQLRYDRGMVHTAAVR
eukprot:365242-Chlamydomonas_euryale.AAC.4